MSCATTMARAASCLNDMNQYPNIDCKRGDIVNADAFITTLAGVCETEDGLWHLKAAREGYAKVFLDYSEVLEDELTTNIVVDLPRCAELHSSTDLRPVVFAFLGQFKDLNKRWSNFYKDMIVEAINLFTSYQEQRLSQIPRAPASLIDGSMLITLALRCVVTSHRFANIHYCWLPSSDVPNYIDFHACIAETKKSTHGGGYSPRIEV
ncbi:uncharacterized protein BDZ99DRAFT_114735 [Mytilinidion resinicola]|uniref:Uncharacterized protein n=1 Tax=Mytilinidion resinicola TaxID=574789 RepID=A0A6A6Y8L7_9PEZI|nr:uncharacterized protein BDZ99DRAFT_114735 [Mytilinidion resinicola]KAF2805176.1 hypothetical protein BDZ99DRAFT_114735 [Mytilinidion resinicola]